MPTVFTFTPVVYLAEKQQVSAVVFGLVGHEKDPKKQTQRSHQNITCSRLDIAEKLLPWQ
jgi:hypothetical protein